MLTFTGTHITREFGAPNVWDMAVQGMRIVRFAGAFEKYFWPIAMHSLLVADLLPKSLEHHGLLHDVASEIIMCDIPRPHKTDEQKVHEKRLMLRTYKHLGLKPPTKRESKMIHAADMQAVCIEGVMGCGPRGFRETQNNCRLGFLAKAYLQKYLDRYDPLDYLNADGYWARHFERRLLSAIRDARLIDYTKPA